MNGWDLLGVTIFIATFGAAAAQWMRSQSFSPGRWWAGAALGQLCFVAAERHSVTTALPEGAFLALFAFRWWQVATRPPEQPERERIP